MSDYQSDAFVFFGATGDLAYKKIFPALHAMMKRGHLNVPVVGVAKSGWTLDQFRGRARESVEQHGAADATAFAMLSRLCAMSMATIGRRQPPLPRRLARNAGCGRARYLRHPRLGFGPRLRLSQSPP